MKFLRLSTRWDALRRSFWFLPAVAMLLGAVLGWGIGSLDDAIELRFGVVSFSDPGSARQMLQTIATVTVTVIGISFSVTVVALQLASQQLGPRVLRTFQGDALNKFVLSLFLGLFIYCLVVLTTLDVAEGASVPELAVAVAIALAIIAFGSFVAFIHNIVDSLQASTLITRIAADAQRALKRPFPGAIGSEPPDPLETAGEVARRTSTGRSAEARAPKGGWVTAIDGERLMQLAESEDLLVLQRIGVGEYAVTGAALAELWTPRDLPPDVLERIATAFGLSSERTVVQDVAFPVRQLADVALRALSPGMNDPTTAENAIDALADLLVRFAGTRRPAPIRVDDQGTPRFVALAPDIDDLVRLGFEQVRIAAAAHPVFAARMIALLRHIEHAAAEHAIDSAAAGRQARLLREGVVGEVPTGADERLVRGGGGPAALA